MALLDKKNAAYVFASHISIPAISSSAIIISSITIALQSTFFTVPVIAMYSKETVEIRLMGQVYYGGKIITVERMLSLEDIRTISGA